MARLPLYRGRRVRRPIGQNDDGGFLRPHDPWQCGLADQGQQCPPGPLPGGQCPGASACRPQRQGDRWLCNRSDLRGGACEEGPTLDGACPLAYHCVPRPTLRRRRGRLVLAVFALALGLAAIGLSGSYRNDLLAPGPLSRSHAQLTNRSSSAERCGNCHAAGDRSIGQWLAATFGDQPLGASQSELCLKCHRESIPGEAPLIAHHNPDLLAGDVADAATPRRRDPHAAIACSACHREHQAAGHDLTRVGNDACHACHAQTFTSFADGHPEFRDWPHSKSQDILFDHRTHQSKHFPAQNAPFDCAACHRSDEDRAGQLTRDYAAACSRCHDQSITASLAGGVPLLALPMIDEEAMAEAGVEAGPWPDHAKGDFDGVLPILLRLLLAERETLENARATLGPSLDFYDVEYDNPEHLQAAGEVIEEIRRLFDDLGREGYRTIDRRVERLTGTTADAETTRTLLANLSAETIAAVRQGWLAGKSAGADPAPAQTAWQMDDPTTTLSYVSTGHADSLLRAWIELAVAGANGPYWERVEPLLMELTEPTAAGLCATCHQVSQNDHGQWHVAWQFASERGSSSTFTRFSHGPHLLQPQLANCTSCHVIAEEASRDIAPGTAEFLPITREGCANCHTPHGAGDRCVDCHRYHVGR